MIRRLLLLIVWLVAFGYFTAPVEAQTFVRDSTLCTTSSASTTCSFTSNTAGNQIIFMGYINTGSATPAATDSAGNTYTSKANTNCSAAGMSVFVLEADNINASAGTNTITWTGNATAREAEGFEYSGLAASSFDKFACTSLAAQTAPSSGSTATTTQANELVMAFYADASVTITSTDSTTSRSTDSAILLNRWGDKNVSATGTYAATGTCTSSTATMAVATFKKASTSTSTQVGGFVVGP